MKKRIHMLLLLLLTMLCLSGCGRQGKVSNKLFEQALDAYQEYFRHVTAETDGTCAVLLSLDSTGIPVMMIARTDAKEYHFHFNQITISVYTFAKGKVVPLLEKTLDESDDFALYSDGIVSIAHADETVWYQVKKGKLIKIAYSDSLESITFHMGKKDIEINLQEEDSQTYKKVYEKICKKLYGQKNIGISYGKEIWLMQLQHIVESIHSAFLQSPSLGGTAPLSRTTLLSMLDSSTFTKMVSNLKQHGSMDNDEFLVWYYNYQVEPGINPLTYDLSNAQDLVYRNPLLLNEIDDFRSQWEKEYILLRLLSYFEHTRNWKMAEQIELLKDIDRDYLDEIQSYLLFENASSVLLDSQFHSYDTIIYDSYVDISTYKDSWFNRSFSSWPQEIENGERPLEDLLFKKHVTEKIIQAYARLANEKDNVAYIRSGMELVDTLPKLMETWRADYLNSKQLEKDYEKYIKDCYVAYLEENYGDRLDVYFCGYAFVKTEEDENLCLLAFNSMGTFGSDSLELLIYDNGHVNVYYDGGHFYWDENIKGFLTENWGSMGFALMYPWTIKNGKLYVFAGKHQNVSYADWETMEYYLFDEVGEVITDNFWSYHDSSKEVSRQEYDEALPEYSDLTQYPRLVEPGYIPHESEQNQIFGKTYTTINEAYAAYLKNPTGEIEVLTIESDETSEVIISDETTEESPMVQQSEVPLDINVDEEVTQIRAWFNETQSNLNSYSSEDDGDVLRYYDNGYLCKMVIDKGYHNWGYAREYYFQDGELYFAFVFDGSEEHRLYFKNNQLIRYIDENKNTYNYGDTEQFSDWSVPVIAEAYELSY